jgi:hypothetical protein
MRILEDFDKYHPIPRELGKYNYIYASGSSKNEVRRHFIVPPEVYESYKEKANTIFHSRYVWDRFPFYFRKKDRVNMIAPLEHSYGYKVLLLTSCTSSNPDNRNCELRNKRKIIKQFTTQELDIVEKELDEMLDESDSKSQSDENLQSKENHIGSKPQSGEDHMGSEAECEDGNDSEPQSGEDDADDTPHS